VLVENRCTILTTLRGVSRENLSSRSINGHQRTFLFGPFIKRGDALSGLSHRSDVTHFN